MALGLLAVATLGGVALLLKLGLGVYSLGVLVVTIGVGVAYLREYAQRPLARPPVLEAVVEPEEPFEDPVEEAARLDARRVEPADPATPPSDAAPNPDGTAPATDDGLETD